MKYRYGAVGRFWTSFYRLTPALKESARKAWIIFKEDSCDARLRTHKIHRLPAAYGRTIYAVEIEADLRSLFYLNGETVVSLVIGTRDIYKG